MTCQGLAVRFTVQQSVIPDCILIEMVLSFLLRAPQSFTLQSSSNWQRPRVSVSVMLTLRGSRWWNIKHRLAEVQKCVCGWLVCGRRDILYVILVQKWKDGEQKEETKGHWGGDLKQKHHTAGQVVQEKKLYGACERDSGQKKKVKK